jgi:arsenate reductase
MYGIPACDTVKKARAWLDAHSVAYTFHDYKKGGAHPSLVAGWVDRLGWEALLNRAGTTFRKLDAANKDGLDAEKAVALMVAHPSLIRRPVVDHGDQLLVGFKPDAFAAAFG